MRNYSNKSNKVVTRYRTPSSFKVRRAEISKRVKVQPFRDPGRGHKTNIGRS